MNRKLLPLLITALIAGCGGKGGGSNGPTVTFSSSQISIDTGKFTVPPGDSLTCIYTGVEMPQDFSVSGSSGYQAPGGHHIIAYYSTQAPEVSLHPCVDTEMLNWNFITGAGADGSVIQYLPPGVDLKIPAHTQLVLQAHYINTSGAPETVESHINLTLIDPSLVHAYAAPFVVDNEAFSIPTGSVPYENTATCTVPSDLQIAMLMGHEHTHGTHFTLAQMPTTTAGTPTVLYDTAWEPYYMTHPPIQLYPMSAPLKFSAGTKLKVTCDWVNDTSAPLNFPDEMCVSFMFYWPDTGSGMQLCQ